MEEVENENEHKRSKNRSPSPAIKSTAVVKYTAFQTPATYAQLQCNTDLNLPPSNYGSPVDSYGLKQILTRGPGMSSFRMAHMFPDCVGEVDVIAGAEVIKKLLKLPYQPQGTVSMMVHRVENTLLLDDFDVYDYLMKSEWSWLKDFFYENILKTMSEQERMSLTMAPVSKSALQLTNKFLSHSLAQAPPTHLPHADTHTRTITGPFLPEPEMKPEEPPHEQLYNRNVHWTFEDIHMLIGSDLPIFGDKDRPCVSLRLRDAREPINVLTGIDYWLDNLMCNVPEVLMCYHLDGIVQKYEPMKTEDLPNMEHSKFSPKVIRNVAQNILSFLKSNATKAGHTYWLFKGPHDDVVKLYDLTSLCPGDLDNPFTTPVAMLLYRVARNMRITNRSRHVRQLLEHVVTLLQDSHHPQIVASSHYMLADLYVPATTNPATPDFKDESSDSDDEDIDYTDFEQCERDSNMHAYTSEQDTPPDEEEIIVESDGVEREENSGSSEKERDGEPNDIVESGNALAVQTRGLALRDIGDRVNDNNEDRKSKPQQGKGLGDSPPDRCGKALLHALKGLLALHNVTIDKSKTTVSRAIRQVTEALNHPSVYKKYVVWPMQRQERNQIKAKCLLAARALHYDPITVGKIVNACSVLDNIANSNRVPLTPLTPEEEDTKRQQQHQEEERERLKQQIIIEEQHPKMANPYEPIKMDYEPLKKQKEGSRSRRRKRDRKSSNQSDNYLIESNSSVDKNAISILKEKKLFPTWHEPNRDDNFAWKLHLKTLLYEKICLAYATLAEFSYAKEQYGFSLKYINMASKCQKLLSHMIIKSKVVDVSCLIGRVGDNYFQMSKHWGRMEQFKKQFETDHHTDIKLRSEIGNDMEEEVDDDVSDEFDLDISLPASETEAMLLSCSAYRRGAAAALERRAELLRRLASVNNELAVRYMNDAQQIYIKYTEEPDQKSTQAKLLLKQFNQLSRKSLECLEEATEIFRDVSDQANLALLFCNKGRYLRFKAHCDQTPGFGTEKRSLYNQAEELYLQALKLLGPRESCGAASIWELVSWELSCHLYTKAVLMQDEPGLYALEVTEVAEALKHALKYCLLSPGPRQYLYQFRAAMIYHRLGSLYHSQYRITQEDGPKRRTLFNATQTNYTRAANMFASLEDGGMFLTVQCEHVALLETQAQVSPNLKLKSLQTAIQLLRQCHSIMKLLSDKDPEDLKETKPDPEDKSIKSEHSLLNLFENRLHYILKSIIQYCRSKSNKDYEKMTDMYKKLYCSSLKIKKNDVLKEYASSVCDALVAMDEISKDFE